jgi:hypothetical protein
LPELSRVNIQKMMKVGFEQINLELPPEWQKLTQERNFTAIENLYKEDLETNGTIKRLSDHVFSLLSVQGEPQVEHMLALRSGPEDEEMEGIWHDDSSRHFAISLSLSLEPQEIEGGELEIRPLKSTIAAFSLPGTRPFGQASVFLTGKYGFEHRTRRVTAGNRLVLVIWVSSSIEGK